MLNNLTGVVGAVSGISDDSRKVKEGYLFVAVKGETVDGHDFIDSAIKNGAKIVIGEAVFKAPDGVRYIQVEDSRLALGKLASDFFGNPTNKMKVIGVTGTKGKTTTTHLIYHILSHMGEKAGLVSSIVAKIGDKEVDTGFHVTSPSVIELHKLAKEMVEAGCKYMVLEVSSHGIAQKRIAGVDFEVGVLTNIAPEHLDYHKTFSEYKRTKMSFINSAQHKVIAPKNTTLNILPGKFNNLNIEAALLAVESVGFDRKAAILTLSSFNLPAGRLQEVKNDKGIRIVVDFAHTAESLEALLKYLKESTKGRLISVFGCAGERDRKKRLKMGAVSARLADLSVFTAEDPRTENIFEILKKIGQGAKSVGAVVDKDYVLIPERGEAISFAMSQAKKGDTIAFLGKGHEKSMAYKGFEHSWSDEIFIKNNLESDSTKAAVILAAGRGSRMRSSYPKVIHEICGRPMIAYTLENLRLSGLKDIVAVVSFRKNLVIRKIKGNVRIAVQNNAKGGTADAARSGLLEIDSKVETVIVINGDDSAFYTPSTIKNVISEHLKNKCVLTFVSLEKENPQGLGRVIRDNDGNVLGIVEEKYTTEEQKLIKEVNDGLYVFNRKWLDKNIVQIKKNHLTNEYYITDLIKIAVDQKEKIMAYKLPNPEEWQGINTPEELEKAQRKMEEKIERGNHYD